VIDVEFKRTGAIFCATNATELKTLQGEYKNSVNRGVEVELIEDPAIFNVLEPLLNANVIAVLHFPKAGILSPWELTIGLAEHAVLNGVDLYLGFTVAMIARESKTFTIHSTDKKTIKTKTIVNAAGLYSDQIAKMVGDESFSILPRRGEYIMFDKHALPLKKIIFPTPDVVSKGIVVGPTIHGNFYVGPNATEIDNKEAFGTSNQGLNEILEGGMKLVRELPIRKHITNFAGIRASTIQHDFIVELSTVPQFVHAAGIDSPGLTSCLAIAERVEQIIQTQCGYNMIAKRIYIPQRKSPIRYKNLSEIQLAEKIRENPQWGQMVCRCELVTEAEIVAACHAPIPAINTDMIKRRLRPGMGRCQGGFCQAKIMKIISRENGIIYEQVTKTGHESRIVFHRSKNLCSQIYEGETL